MSRYDPGHSMVSFGAESGNGSNPGFFRMLLYKDGYLSLQAPKCQLWGCSPLFFDSKILRQVSRLHPAPPPRFLTDACLRRDFGALFVMSI